ncbi:glycosyltransferase family 2 protein [Candidatus Shapirobacteria bacterium]|nr:glycosyltransferase family 2 protein [Candidatus Shapirobacteria bacterium]
MKKTFTQVYSQYITQKKLNASLKKKIWRLRTHRFIAWNDFNKLTSVISFRLWQQYNHFKKYLVKPVFLFPFKSIFIVVYLAITICLYFIYKIFHFSSSFFSKPLPLSSLQAEIDGVSFIIPTWNKAKMVTDCVKKLSSILEIESPKVKKEIIIVNNGSADNTIKSITSINSSISIRLINLPKNVGFASAINLGVIESMYNYIYLMNNDMIPTPTFLSSIINFAQAKINQGSKFFGISSQIFFFDKNKRREESGKTYIYPYFGIIRAGHIVNSSNLQDPSPTCYPGGGSSLLNKHIFQKLGGYNSTIYRPMYCEDLDQGFLAWQYGFPSYFVPQSHIIHHHRSSSKKLTTDPSHYLFKNLLTFSLKNITSFSLFLKHIFYFPILSIIDDHHFNYLLGVLPIIPSIYLYKVRSLKYKYMHQDTSLFDFIKFEVKNDQF